MSVTVVTRAGAWIRSCLRARGPRRRLHVRLEMSRLCPDYVLYCSDAGISLPSSSTMPTDRSSPTTTSSGIRPSCTSRGTPAETSAAPTFAVSWRPLPRSRLQARGWSSSRRRAPIGPRPGATSSPLGDALVIADPERTLYKALGARRPKPLWVLRPRVAAAGMRALLAGERVGVTSGDDTLQLGADVVVDQDGQIAFLHLASDAADRTPPEELIAVLRRLDRAPTWRPRDPALRLSDARRARPPPARAPARDGPCRRRAHRLLAAGPRSSCRSRPRRDDAALRSRPSASISSTARQTRPFTSTSGSSVASAATAPTCPRHARPPGSGSKAEHHDRPDRPHRLPDRRP